MRRLRRILALLQAIPLRLESIHVYQVGSDQEGFFRFYEREVMTRLA